MWIKTAAAGSWDCDTTAVEADLGGAQAVRGIPMSSSILVPIDVAQPSSWEHAIPKALELAATAGGARAITVMTVVRDLTMMFESAYFPFQVENMVEEARRKLQAIVSNYAASGVTVASEVRLGHIGAEILAVAKERAVDLIVMESHRPEMLDYLIGSNAAFVTRHARCSVLVLRRPAPGQ